ncbi:MAG: GNAT family N-acetyltransferase [Clostridia bacterium]|nr:GNAT family N-acetyltransferase [Clostridia bacterium]
MNEQAIAYLEKNLSLQIDLIEMLRRGRAGVRYLSDHACLLEGAGRTGYVLLACDDPASGQEALRSMEAPYRLVVAHGRAAWDAVKRERPSFDCKRPCHLAYYPGKEPQPVPKACTIAPYPIERLDAVLAHYDNVNDPAYIVGRIEAGELFAGYYDGELCGFIGFHDDGSMGMLEVFEPFRRLHIGYALEQNLINIALSRGWVPYCHIFEGNEPSLNLQKKLGLSVTPACEVAWMHAPRE